MKLSVVVPYYNVELYIHDCLASIAGQTMGDLQVILVDDGSRDGSRDVAEDFARTDPRFRLVTQANQGLGPARNTGMQHATGTYLTFVDSDDVIPREAWALMTRRLERTGSDFAAGDAQRFNVHGVRESWLHQDPFARDVSRTTVRKMPELAHDRMIWNKVFRRSFWERGGYEFPAIMYEDYPVTLRAHLDATSVEVVSTPIYLWRERDAGETSITQRVFEVHNVRDRVSSAMMVLDLLEDAPPAVRRTVHEHLARTDVGAVARAIIHPDSYEHRAELVSEGQRLVSRIDPDVIAGRPPLDRVQYALILSGQFEELARLIAVRDQELPPASHERSGLLGRHPRVTLVDTDLSSVPDELLRLTPEEIELHVTVLAARWRTGDEAHRVELDLRANVSFSGPVTQPAVRAWLQSRRRGERLAVDVVPGVETDPNGDVRVTVVADTRTVAEQSGDRTTAWVLHVELDTGTLTRSGTVGRVAPGSAFACPPRIHEKTRWVQPGQHHGEYVLRVLSWPAHITSVRPGYADELVLEGSSQPVPADTLLLVHRSPQRQWHLPVLVDPADPTRWRANLPLNAVADPDHVDPFVDTVASWGFQLLTPCAELAVALDPRVPDTRVAHRGREVQIVGNRFHVARLDEMKPQLTVEQVVDRGEGDLRLHGRWLGEGVVDTAVLQWHHDLDHPEEVVLPVMMEGPDFAVDVDVRPLLARTAQVLARDHDTPDRDPGKGAWNLTFRCGDRTLAGHVTLYTARRLPAPWRTEHGVITMTTHRRWALRFAVAELAGDPLTRAEDPLGEPGPAEISRA